MEPKCASAIDPPWVAWARHDWEVPFFTGRVCALCRRVPVLQPDRGKMFNRSPRGSERCLACWKECWFRLFPVQDSQSFADDSKAQACTKPKNHTASDPMGPPCPPVPTCVPKVVQSGIMTADYEEEPKDKDHNWASLSQEPAGAAARSASGSPSSTAAWGDDKPTGRTSLRAALQAWGPPTHDKPQVV
jgi:hypothetical protein